MEKVVQFQWWRLIISPPSHNELPSVKLSWAWEPMHRDELAELVWAKDLSIMILAKTWVDEARKKSKECVEKDKIRKYVHCP